MWLQFGVVASIAIACFFYSDDVLTVLCSRDAPNALSDSESTASDARNARFSTDSVENFLLYRYGEFRHVPKSSARTVDELLAIARQLFDDASITALRTHIGLLITTLSDVGASRDEFIVCLDAQDRFMFPALRVGQVTSVPILDVNARNGSRVVHMRSVSVRPRVFEIPHFLTDAECDHLVEIARSSHLEKSKVGGDVPSKGEYRDVRTSTQMWIGQFESKNTPVVDQIRARVFQFVQLSSDVAESMQLVHYGLDEHYLGHHDYAHKWESTDNPYVQAGGNRYVTLIFYLNDVLAGGETAFPFGNSTRRPLLDANGKDRIWVQVGNRQVYYGYEGCDGDGLRIKPIKGSAVMFYNLLEQHTWDAEPDSFTLHAGCDVLRGEKYMANFWLRNRRVNGKLFDAHW